VVIERAVDVGQTVAASLSSPILFNIAQDLKQIQIEANVDEADIGNVKQGNRVTFAVDAFPDMEFSGEVEQVRLSPTELQNVVTYTVIINARNPDLKLLPGMTAIVEIVTGESRDVLRVSNDALRFRPPKEFQTETASSDQDSPFAGGGAPGRNAFPGGRQGNPMSRNLDQITANLGIDDKQKQQISDGLEAFFTDMRSNAGTGGMFGSVDSTDPAVMQERMQATRQRMTGEVEKVFRQYLTEDQFRQYQQYMRIQSEARRGQVWITPDGIKIEPRQIRMGISDDSFTEILSGVEEGDEVVTRIREVSL
jgi:HlyD family secretion protein